MNRSWRSWAHLVKIESNLEVRPAWHAGNLLCNDATRRAAHSAAVGKQTPSQHGHARVLVGVVGGEADIAGKDIDVFKGRVCESLNQFSANSQSSLLMVFSQISLLQERPWFGRLWGENSRRTALCDISFSSSM